MCEHHGSSSAEETWSEHESASVTSFDDGEPICTAYYRLKEQPVRPLRPADHDASPIFPFSLLSACSAQGRAVAMSQYTRSSTLEDTVSSATSAIGLRGE